tara:strand:- start:9678 stop:9965 length:288 start_codon:yes stop_codon:yes gene_type:complete
MKTTLQNAIKLARLIEAKYDELDADNIFFNLYHDDLRIQSDCAWEEIGELSNYLKSEQEHYAQFSMQNLKDTLAYVTYIIDMQNQLKNCPKSIYG